MKKKILIALACIIAVAGVFCGIYLPNSEINNTIKDVQNIVTEQIEIEQEKEKQNIIITNETQEIVEETIEKVDNGEDISTTEIIESSEEEEIDITDEGALETDAVIEQENISYDGDSTGDGLSLLGAYQGLTYYSQADSRWASVMYSSIGDSSQTMKSSACGPTSAAIVVSSSKGAILPTTMANLAVANGYRTSNNGTAWAYFPFVADYFDFNEYYTTSNFDTAMNYLKTDNDKDGNSDYYIVCSCGSGLFTSGGHYIALVANNGGTITVYDPYLYSGKFNTASRRNAGVVVSGNSAYVSESSFRNYANYRYFWIFSNDKGNGNTNKNTNTDNTTSVNYTRYVATQSSNLNVRTGAWGTVITSLRKGTEVTVVETDGAWSRITSPVNGWVSTGYLSSTSPTGEITTTTTSGMPTSGTVRVNTSLNVRTGPGTQYKYVKSLYNGNNVYIYESRNGWYRIGTNLWVCAKYVNTSNSVPSSSNYSTSIGSYYRLKYNTTLYKNGNLSGTTYSYLAKTQIKVISHYSNSIDYIYVPKTGRYAYCKVQAFK
ncbi:MAG: SH3 domain-containing protein [Clostridia bacterium]|nr:SH3 domain-containing protein [Clostridia bacterium]